MLRARDVGLKNGLMDGLRLRLLYLVLELDSMYAEGTAALS